MPPLSIRFSLRALLLATLLVAVGLTAFLSRPAQRIRAAISAKEKGFVWFEYEGRQKPHWTDTYFGSVTRIDFPRNRPAQDSDIRFVTSLHKLTELNLPNAKIGEKTLTGLSELTELQWLNLGETNISDASVTELDGLQHLRSLSLYNTNVTDRSMPAVGRLPSLENLTVAGTNITDQGIALLVKAQPSKLSILHLSGTLVTDACVEDLSRILSLRLLIIDNGTDITPKAIATLLQRRPNLRVRREMFWTPKKKLENDRTTESR